MGLEEIEALRRRSPEVWGRICALLEDEALNSDLSPTLLSAYLKRRLGYGEKSEHIDADCGQMTLVFEHDIAEDGA